MIFATERPDALKGSHSLSTRESTVQMELLALPLVVVFLRRVSADLPDRHEVHDKMLVSWESDA